MEPDESDVEWNIDIIEEFGVRRGGANRDSGRRLDEGMDMDGLVQHTFHLYDRMVGNVFDTRDGADLPVGDDPDAAGGGQE